MPGGGRWELKLGSGRLFILEEAKFTRSAYICQGPVDHQELNVEAYLDVFASEELNKFIWRGIYQLLSYI